MFGCIVSVCQVREKKKGSGMLLEEIILCYNSRCRKAFIGNIKCNLISHGQAKGCQDSKEDEEPPIHEVIART